MKFLSKLLSRLLLDDPREEPEFYKDAADAAMEQLPDLSNGYGLWRRKEPHGGYSYWTDDVGGGRLVFDEGVDDIGTLLELLERLNLIKRSFNLTDADINDITYNNLGKWPSFHAQSWACKVAHEVLSRIAIQKANETEKSGT